MSRTPSARGRGRPKNYNNIGQQSDQPSIKSFFGKNQPFSPSTGNENDEEIVMSEIVLSTDSEGSELDDDSEGAEISSGEEFLVDLSEEGAISDDEDEEEVELSDESDEGVREILRNNRYAARENDNHDYSESEDEDAYINQQYMDETGMLLSDLGQLSNPLRPIKKLKPAGKLGHKRDKMTKNRGVKKDSKIRTRKAGEPGNDGSNEGQKVKNEYLCTYEGCPSTAFVGTRDINTHLDTHVLTIYNPKLDKRAKKSKKEGKAKAGGEFKCNWLTCDRIFTSLGGVRYHIVNAHNKPILIRIHVPLDTPTNLPPIEQAVPLIPPIINNAPDKVQRKRNYAKRLASATLLLECIENRSKKYKTKKLDAASLLFESHANNELLEESIFYTQALETLKKLSKPTQILSACTSPTVPQINDLIEKNSDTINAFLPNGWTIHHDISPVESSGNRLFINSINHRINVSPSITDYLPINKKIGLILTPNLDKQESICGGQAMGILSKNNKFQYIINTSIAICSVSWIPLTIKLDNGNIIETSPNSPQYLCVMGDSFSDIHSTTYQTKNDKKSMIQVYKCNKLYNNLEVPDMMLKKNMPQLFMGLLSESGVVSKIEWCPFGYDPSINQLGLACMIFGDGKARIFSIPLTGTDDNNSNTNMDNIGLVEGDNNSNNNPLSVEFIHLSDPLYVLEQPMTSIRTVNWMKTGKCNLIAAGCDNGQICIFDLTQETLLINSWVAYDNQPVTQICNMKDSPNILVSTTLDSHILIWDAMNNYVPIYEITYTKTAITKAISFKDPTNLYAAFNNGSVRMYDINYTRLSSTSQSSHSVHDHPYCETLSLDESLWGDFIASSGEDGRVFITKKSHTNASICRLWLAKTNTANEIINYTFSTELSHQQYSTEYSIRTSKSLSNPITFYDSELALNTISMNPNPSSYRFMATGGNAGLVFIMPF